jgi:hypothetical protein
VLSVNEIRALEDLPPVPGGDEFEPLKKIESGTGSGTDSEDEPGAEIVPLKSTG